MVQPTTKMVFNCDASQTEIGSFLFKKLLKFTAQACPYPACPGQKFFFPPKNPNLLSNPKTRGQDEDKQALFEILPRIQRTLKKCRESFLCRTNLGHTG